MAANAIDNTNLLNYRDDQGTTGFNPVINYVYDGQAKEIDVTDDSVFPAGVALKVAHIKVHDKFGGQVNGFIYPAAGGDSGHDEDTTIDVSSLNLSKPLDITATIIADDDMLVADGGAYNIGASGSLGSWDKQKNASA
jgi:hypothetical protein